jgi:hypothetical protein
MGSKNRAMISEMKRRNFGLALTALVVGSYPGPRRAWWRPQAASTTRLVIRLQGRSVNEEVQYEA